MNAPAFFIACCPVISLQSRSFMNSSPWRIGLQSAKAILIPGIVLQIAAVLLIVSYFTVPHVQVVLGRIAQWQERFGVLFSGVSYLLFCGLVPPTICLFIPSLRPRPVWRAYAFAVPFWSLMGLFIAQFYLFQIFLFGAGRDLGTLLSKILFDQFVFSPFLSLPIVAIVHAWKDRGYQWAVVRPLLRRGWYGRFVIPMLVTNWGIWIPCLFVVYSMPSALQPHLAGLISGFGSLICLQIAARTK